MASNYEHRGTDLDDLFQARTTTKRADVGYDVSNIDISNRYEKVGRDQRIPDLDYESGSTNLARLFMGNDSQYSVSQGDTSTRTTQWRNQLIHDARITFSSATARTNFFTYGGRLKWTGSRTGGSSSTKNTDWTNLLNSAGSIELGKTNTYRNNTGTQSSIGSDDLTSSWQTLYQGNGTGAYSTNRLYIQAYQESSNVIRMRAVYSDAATGTIHEYVNGTIVSDIDTRRHPSQSSPSYTTITELTAGN